MEGFHPQLDCKLTYSSKNQTLLTLAFHVQKQNRTLNSNDEKYSQTGITVKIDTNCEQL